MFIKQVTLVLLLCTCAAPIARQDGRRVPRGWTLDASKQELAAVNIREQQAFGEGKIIRADDFDADSLTNEAPLTQTAGKAQLKSLIKTYNQLLCINTALEETVKEHQAKRCFATDRDIKELQVHVATSVSALRKEGQWPEFKVALGGKDAGVFAWAHALDGGTVMFRKMFPVKQEGKDIQGYNMKEAIREITLELRTDERINEHGYINDYVLFKDSFGSEFCVEERWRWLGGCRKETTMQEQVIIETNRLHIDRVEIYLYFADDDRPYKVYASRPSAQEPLVILDNIAQQYSVAGFKNNPHWLLHFYSSRCEAWQEDHDGTKFGEYIWDNYIKQDADPIDIYQTPLHCAGAATVPVYDEPVIPEIKDTDELDGWLAANADNFKPHDNNNQSECQPRTAAIIKQEALDQGKCGKNPETPLAEPLDLDTWSAARLSQAVIDQENSNNPLEISNEKFATDLDKITGSGCFYAQPLPGGIQVKITGQRLVNVGGKLMTRQRANTCIFTEIGGIGMPSNKNNVYINLGLNATSYPIIVNNSGKEADGRFSFEGDEAVVIKEAYTKNFALRDIQFVHLEKTARAEFLSYKSVSTVTHKQFLPWQDERSVGAVSRLVEQGIVAISSIALKFDGNVIYQRGSSPPVEDSDTNIDCYKNDVLDALFVLNNSNNVWVDYNMHGNDAWVAYRDEQDHCATE